MSVNDKVVCKLKFMNEFLLWIYSIITIIINIIFVLLHNFLYFYCFHTNNTKFNFFKLMECLLRSSVHHN